MVLIPYLCMQQFHNARAICWEKILVERFSGRAHLHQSVFKCFGAEVLLLDL